MKVARILAMRLMPASLRQKFLPAWSRFMDRVEARLYPGELLPPRHLRFVGHGDFKKTGGEFLRHFTGAGGLAPHHRVLDVGSGIGRMAIPLTRFLSSTGSYEGLEIVPAGVEWCAKNITPKFPRFRFHWIDVYNYEYNPAGTQKAADYRFPFSGPEFDFAFLTSVFTHMLPSDIENYVAELGRVIKPGGRCFVTYFLLNAASRDAIRRGGLALDFNHEGPGYLTVDEKMPECAIAFPEEDVLDMFKRHGFRLASPINFGTWSGKADGLSYQDVLILEKLG
jgi:SAM-dependent methyltransferase